MKFLMKEIQLTLLRQTIPEYFFAGTTYKAMPHRRSISETSSMLTICYSASLPAA